MLRAGKRSRLRRAMRTAAATMFASHAALAQDAGATVEAWAGAEAFGRIWSLYTGTTVALFAPLSTDGLRLRAVAGYGDYRTGTVGFADFLLGYHAQLGTFTIKVFGGAMLANHNATDPFFKMAGTDLGAKGVVETWWNVTDEIWLNTDFAYGSLHDTYMARMRLGWRLTPELSLGLEGGAAGSLATDIARAGAFLRYEWASGEVTISGGVAREGFDLVWDDTTGAYATLSVLTRF